ncbi:MAG: hypothetical protein JXR05_07780 [Flavobacteriaceae bacterium]
MIKFFRHIRQGLVNENKFSKYFLYAGGEILLVVIGILLALQFNSWNTNNKELEKEEWYLNNILDDIHYQTQTLEIIEKDYNVTIAAAKSILKNYYHQKSFQGIDSLNNKLNLLMYAQFFPNTNNTYQELVSSGQLSLIKNKNLSLEVIDFYLYSADNEEVFKNDLDNIFYPQIYPVVSSLVQVDIESFLTNEDEDYLLQKLSSVSSLIEKKLNDLSTRLALENAIKLKILILSEQLEIIKETQKGAKVLNTLIEDELKEHLHD